MMERKLLILMIIMILWSSLDLVDAKIGEFWRGETNEYERIKYEIILQANLRGYCITPANAMESHAFYERFYLEHKMNLETWVEISKWEYQRD